MMEYSIRELSELAGVSARTLRYYDEIGLLKPTRTSESGYRFYGAGKVDQLQQILFYREWGMSLEQIHDLIYDPHFDRLAALNEHLAALTRQQERTAGLIAAVEKTIRSLKGEEHMNDKEKFEAFKQDLVDQNMAQYGEEIQDKYGEVVVADANRKLLKMSQEEYEHFTALEQELQKYLENAVRKHLLPESEAGKKAAFLHKEWLSMTWTSYSPEAHIGLAQMYIADQRFTQYYDKNVAGCAEFLTAAIEHWVQK